MPDAKFAIAVAQMDCTVGEIEPNLNKIRRLAQTASELGAQLVVFPECAVTGYFVGDKLSELADSPDGAPSKALGDIARSANLHLACGLFTSEGGAIRNTQQMFSPQGECLATYHKAHLFAAERTLCEPGNSPVVVDTVLGRIGMTICYDLIFPEYIRSLIDLGADIVINSTNWIHDPYQRDFWGWGPERAQGLVSTRALENVAFVAMSCRVGHEVAGPDLAFDSFGPSCVVSPSGKILARILDGEGVAVSHVDISESELDRWRGIATYRIDRRPELYR